MNYYKHTDGTIARGVNSTVYNDWTDLGTFPEVDEYHTTCLKITSGKVKLDQTKYDAYLSSRE